MKTLKQRCAILMHLSFAISLFVSQLVTGIAFLFLLLIWPFNKRLYRKIAYYFEYVTLGHAVFLLRYWSSCDLTLYIDKDVYDNYLGKEHSLCILNHRGELDWIILSALLDKVNILGGAKAFVKKSIRFIPLIGWAFYCNEYVFLSRSYEKDKKTLKNSVQAFFEYEHPVTIGLLPEGTRFTPAKHEAGVKFARERGLKELKHHLVPRTKGFTTTIQHMKGKIPALYDVEIVFRGAEATTMNMFNSNKFSVHMYLRRIAMDDVPDSELEQEEFLRDLFYRKDACYESFQKTGDFFKLTKEKPLKGMTIGQNVKCLMMALFCFTASIGPIIYYLLNLLFIGEYLHFAMVVGLVSLGLFVFAKAIEKNMEVKDIQQETNRKLEKKIS